MKSFEVEEEGIPLRILWNEGFLDSGRKEGGSIEQGRTVKEEGGRFSFRLRPFHCISTLTGTTY